MTRTIKKPRAVNSGPRQKITNTSGALVSLYDSIVTDEKPFVNIPVCWQCGFSKNLTAYHAAGGALAICVRCNDGGQV